MGIEWNRTHPKNIRDAVTRYRNKIREIIAALRSKPCADCGQTFPSECMDFDHVKGKKLMNISRTAYGLKKRLDEIKKCEIVCANCHRIRTARRARKERVVHAS